MRKIKQLYLLVIFGLVYSLITLYALVFNTQTGWSMWFFASLFLFVEFLGLMSSLKRLFVESPNLVTEVNQAQAVSFAIKKSSARLLFFPYVTLTGKQLHPEKKIWFFHKNSLIEVVWTPKKRGNYSEVVVTLVASDLFDWLQKRRKISVPVSWMVLPMQYPYADKLQILFQRILQQNENGENDFSIKNYRPYQPGDALKHIDWKLSSREDELMWREYQMYQKSDWILVFYGQKSIYFEEMLTVVYTLFQQWHLTSRQLKLLGNQIEQTDELLQQFAQIEPFETPPEIVKEKKKMIVFVPEKSDNLIEALVATANPFEIYTYQDIKRLEGQQ
ncbi:DUF58 domain-containing protein [Enterococcus saccharolyticus]|uniref:DUF58 domain-containing protein n=1 Tax=Enterococcus saccharolyticus TaxID=41997 RepID=UPI001E59123D|nr:DUF58 domain-containing protein [Enterococcus saccharolyticus]MCD5000949.1 DUF58 domain-containing protein [Enterococcus saccharolyticus]